VRRKIYSVGTLTALNFVKTPACQKIFTKNREKKIETETASGNGEISGKTLRFTLKRSDLPEKRKENVGLL